MLEYGDMVSGILTEAGGCPDMVLERNLRNSAIEFFNATELWKTTLVSIVPSNHQVDVKSLLAAGNSLVRVEGASIDGVSLKPVDSLRVLRTNSKEYFASEGSDVYLSNKHPEDATVDIRVSIKPNLQSEGIPIDLASDWFEALGWGALYRVLGMEGSPWADLRRAGFYQQQYSSMIEQGIRVARGSNKPRILNTRFSW